MVPSLSGTRSVILWWSNLIFEQVSKWFLEGTSIRSLGPRIGEVPGTSSFMTRLLDVHKWQKYGTDRFYLKEEAVSLAVSAMRWSSPTRPLFSECYINLPCGKRLLEAQLLFLETEIRRSVQSFYSRLLDRSDLDYNKMFPGWNYP